MNRKIIILSIVLIAFKISYSQDLKDKVLYSQGQSIDTSINPDYYAIEITVSEFFSYNDERKNKQSTKILIDSVRQLLLLQLTKFVDKNELILSEIFDRDYKTYGNEIFLKASYRLTVDTKEKVESIFKAITENFPLSALQGIEVRPKLNQSTIKKAQIELEKIALERVTNDVKNYAERNKMIVQKIENYEIEFGQKNNYDSYYLQPRQINISFLAPVFTLTVKHTFSLK